MAISENTKSDQVVAGPRALRGAPASQTTSARRRPRGRRTDLRRSDGSRVHRFSPVGPRVARNNRPWLRSGCDSTSRFDRYLHQCFMVGMYEPLRGGL